MFNNVIIFNLFKNIYTTTITIYCDHNFSFAVVEKKEEG